jgi:hypothetical protein
VNDSVIIFNKTLETGMARGRMRGRFSTIGLAGGQRSGRVGGPERTGERAVWNFGEIFILFTLSQID